jgi:hypothetical protein
VTLALVGLAVLAVVIFAFVLEPIVRARGDRAVLDAAVLPEHDEPVEDDEFVEQLDSEPASEVHSDDRLRGGRVAIDRPAGSDAS